MCCMTVLDFNIATLQAYTTGYRFPISNKFYGRVDSLRSLLRRGTGKERNERSSSLGGGRQRKKPPGFHYESDTHPAVPAEAYYSIS